MPSKRPSPVILTTPTFITKWDWWRVMGARPMLLSNFFARSLQLNPNLWPAHSSLGALLGKDKHFDEGIAELNKAKALAPSEPSIRENLASIYFAKGEYDTAIAEYHELFRMNPSWKHGHESLARAYMAKNEYTPAIAELKLAVEQNPNSAPEHRALGQLLLAADHQAEAIRELRASVELDPIPDLSLFPGHGITGSKPASSRAH